MTDTTGMFAGELVRRRLIQMDAEAQCKGRQSPLHADMTRLQRMYEIDAWLHRAALDPDEACTDALIEAAARLLAWVEAAAVAERGRVDTGAEAA